MLGRVRAAWPEAGRQDEPRLAALVYFSLGEEVDADSRAYLRHYYRWLGEHAEIIAEGAVRTETSIRDTVAQFEDVGVTELYFDPTVASYAQSEVEPLRSSALRWRLAIISKRVTPVVLRQLSRTSR